MENRKSRRLDFPDKYTGLLRAEPSRNDRKMNKMNKNKTLLQKFTDFNAAKPDGWSKKKRILLTVSGGIDSVVLCDLFHKAGYPFAIAHCQF